MTGGLDGRNCLGKVGMIHNCEDGTEPVQRTGQGVGTKMRAASMMDVAVGLDKAARL